MYFQITRIVKYNGFMFLNTKKYDVLDLKLLTWAITD